MTAKDFIQIFILDKGLRVLFGLGEKVFDEARCTH
jgi:hypothetical protein